MSAKEGEKAKTDEVPIQVQLDKMSLQNARLKGDLLKANTEVTLARRKVKEYQDYLGTRLTNETKLDIQHALKCSDLELARLTEGKDLEALEGMFNTIVVAQGDKKPAFASVKSGGSLTAGDSALTVPPLYGKSRKEIREALAAM